MERFLFSRIETWLAMLLSILALFLGGLWAVAVLQYKVFPYAQIEELRTVIRSVPGDERPIWTRITASWRYDPRTFPASRDTALLTSKAYRPITPAPGASGVLPVWEAMRLATPVPGETRYYLIYGSFAFPEQRETLGTILIDSDGLLHRAWPADPRGGEYLGPHIGLALSPKGVITTNAKGVMTAQDWCGPTLWQAAWAPHPDGRKRDENGLDGYGWHHDISWYDGAFWSFEGPRIVAVEEASGDERLSVHPIDLIRWSWNQGLGLWDPPAKIFFPAQMTRETLVDLMPPDPFHLNKVAPLTADQAGAYSGLEAGDLLISARDMNLVAILRPSEKRFVWWRYGLSSRQHDVQFTPEGIEFFNNAPFTNPSKPTIRRLDFEAQDYEDIFDLSQFGMVMRRKGNFERDGDRLVTVDDEAGQMIAARLDGTLETVFVNAYPADGDDPETRLQLRAATEIAAGDVARFQARCQ